MESCIQISLSEYMDPDQSQQFDHSGRNEIWREPFPPARTCDTLSLSYSVTAAHVNWVVRSLPSHHQSLGVPRAALLRVAHRPQAMRDRTAR